MFMFPMPRLVCFNTQPQPHPLIRLQNIDDLEEIIRPGIPARPEHTMHALNRFLEFLCRVLECVCFIIQPRHLCCFNVLSCQTKGQMRNKHGYS